MKKFFWILSLALLLSFNQLLVGENSEVFAITNENNDADNSSTSADSCTQVRDRFVGYYSKFSGNNKDEFFNYVFYEALRELFFDHGVWLKQTGTRGKIPLFTVYDSSKEKKSFFSTKNSKLFDQSKQKDLIKPNTTQLDQEVEKEKKRQVYHESFEFGYFHGYAIYLKRLLKSPELSEEEKKALQHDPSFSREEKKNLELTSEEKEELFEKFKAVEKEAYDNSLSFKQKKKDKYFPNWRQRTLKNISGKFNNFKFKTDASLEYTSISAFEDGEKIKKLLSVNELRSRARVKALNNFPEKEILDIKETGLDAFDTFDLICGNDKFKFDKEKDDKHAPTLGNFSHIEFACYLGTVGQKFIEKDYSANYLRNMGIMASLSSFDLEEETTCPTRAENRENSLIVKQVNQTPKSIIANISGRESKIKNFSRNLVYELSVISEEEPFIKKPFLGFSGEEILRGMLSDEQKNMADNFQQNFNQEIISSHSEYGVIKQEVQEDDLNLKAAAIARSQSNFNVDRYLSVSESGQTTLLDTEVSTSKLFAPTRNILVHSH